MIQITTHLLARAVRAGDAGLSANDSKSTFDRMFQRFDSFFDRATDALNAALLEIGKPWGILDANDNLAAGPVALMLAWTRQAAGSNRKMERVVHRSRS